MAANDTAVYANSKLKKLSKDILGVLWDLRHPDDPEQDALTLEAIRAELAAGSDPLPRIKVSTTTVGKFYKWLKLKRRLDEARDTSNQMMEDLMEKGDLDGEEMAKLGQKFFMAEALKSGDPASFVQLRKLMLEETRQRLETEKNQLRMKEKIEAGLDELYKEIKGNKKAEKLFEELKQVVASS